MSGKLGYLRRRCNDADDVCTQVIKKYSLLEEEYKNLKHDIDVLQQSKLRLFPTMRVITVSSYALNCMHKRLQKIVEERNELTREIQDARDKQKLCKDEYIAYKEKYDSLVDIKQEQEAKQRALVSPNPKIFAGNETNIIYDEKVAENGAEISHTNIHVEIESEEVTVINATVVAEQAENTIEKKSDVLSHEEEKKVLVDIVVKAVEETIFENVDVNTIESTESVGDNSASVDESDEEMMQCNNSGSEEQSNENPNIAEESALIEDATENDGNLHNEKKSKINPLSNFKKNKPQ